MKNQIKRKIMSAMNFPALIRIFMVLSMTAPSMAAEPYVAWPSKEQLRGIEQAAYACSRANSTEACKRVRQLADPLMDHSRLPERCKDVLWMLMDEAKVANNNDFRRKDTITNTARRIPRFCAEPVTKNEKLKSRQA
jgi:hypothetical protein